MCTERSPFPRLNSVFAHVPHPYPSLVNLAISPVFFIARNDTMRNLSLRSWRGPDFTSSPSPAVLAHQSFLAFAVGFHRISQPSVVSHFHSPSTLGKHLPQVGICPWDPPIDILSWVLRTFATKFKLFSKPQTPSLKFDHHQ